MRGRSAGQSSLSLGRRLVVLVACTATLLAAVYIGAGVWLSRREMEGEHRRGACLVAGSVATHLREAVLTRDHAALQVRLEEALGAAPDTAYAFVLDRAGEVLAPTVASPPAGDLVRFARRHRDGAGCVTWTLSTERGQVLHVATPLEGRDAGQLHLGVPWRLVDARLRGLSAQLGAAMVLGLLVAGFTSTLAYRQTARPVRALTVAAARLGEGDIAARVALGPGADGEIALLGRAFDEMADRIEGQVQALRTSAATLAAEKTRIQAILDGLMQGVLACEPSGAIGFSNALGRAHWGCTEGAPAAWDAVRDTLPEAAALVDEVRGGRADWRRDQVRVGARILSVHVSAIVDAAGQTLGVTIMTADVTDAVEAAQAIAHAEKMNVVGQLAAGVAHEVNSPLDGAIEVARLFERGDCAPDKARRFAAAQRHGLERIAAIVRRLLVFSRQGGEPRRRVPVAALVDEALELVGYQLRERQLRVERSCTSGALIAADPLGLSQVVVNLLSNAIDASSPGGVIRVEASIEGGWMRLAVTDQGPGIPEADGARIFTPFFTTKEVGKGTGLGLAVSHRVVTEHGGRLDYVNAGAPWGACFRVSLPGAEDGADASPDAPRSST